METKDHKFLATGVLCGIITIPFGCFIGGLIAGFNIYMILINLIPITIVSALITIGLFLIPKAMIKAFTVFGKFVVVLAILGLILGSIDLLIDKVNIPYIKPATEGIEVVGGIAITLAGAFCFVYVVTKIFKSPLNKLGKILGINDISTFGLVATLANSIRMFQLMKEMDNRGKVINVAFAVSGAFILGDHLGFTASVAPEMIFPMIVGKLSGGVTAIFIAILMLKRMDKSLKC